MTEWHGVQHSTREEWIVLPLNYYCNIVNIGFFVILIFTKRTCCYSQKAGHENSIFDCT